MLLLTFLFNKKPIVDNHLISMVIDWFSDDVCCVELEPLTEMVHELVLQAVQEWARHKI